MKFSVAIIVLVSLAAVAVSMPVANNGTTDPATYRLNGMSYSNDSRELRGLEGLDLRIKCNLPTAQQFVVFVDPQDNIAEGTLFTDLFPIAWKVARFSPDKGGNQNEEVRLSFSAERTAGISELDEGNQVVASWTSDIVPNDVNWFETEDDEGAYKLVPSSVSHASVSAKISNVVNKKLKVFFGDKSGSPFMYQEVSPQETSEFQEKTKIVIVAVRGYKDSEVISSEIAGTWLKFSVADTRGVMRGTSSTSSTRTI